MIWLITAIIVHLVIVAIALWLMLCVIEENLYKIYDKTLVVCLCFLAPVCYSIFFGVILAYNKLKENK